MASLASSNTVSVVIKVVARPTAALRTLSTLELSPSQCVADVQDHIYRAWGVPASQQTFTLRPPPHGVEPKNVQGEGGSDDRPVIMPLSPLHPHVVHFPPTSSGFSLPPSATGSAGSGSGSISTVLGSDPDAAIAMDTLPETAQIAEIAHQQQKEQRQQQQQQRQRSRQRGARADRVGTVVLYLHTPPGVLSDERATGIRLVSFTQSSTLQELVWDAREGFENQHVPGSTDLIDSTAGVYFLKNGDGAHVAVFKPLDEEQGMPFNPKNWTDCSLRDNFKPGQGCTREVASYALDVDGFCGVPSTALVECQHRRFNYKGNSPYMKLGSLQEFRRSDGTFEDYHHSRYSVLELQKIALYDLRTLNCDRNTANILVTEVFRDMEGDEAVYMDAADGLTAEPQRPPRHRSPSNKALNGGACGGGSRHFIFPNSPAGSGCGVRFGCGAGAGGDGLAGPAPMSLGARTRSRSRSSDSWLESDGITFDETAGETFSLDGTAISSGKGDAAAAASGQGSSSGNGNNTSRSNDNNSNGRHARDEADGATLKGERELREFDQAQEHPSGFHVALRTPPRYISLNRDLSQSPVPATPATAYHLTPIDHSYCIPDSLCICEWDWCWFHNDHIRQPVHPKIREYLLGLDIDEVLERVRKAITVKTSVLATSLSMSSTASAEDDEQRTGASSAIGDDIINNNSSSIAVKPAAHGRSVSTCSAKSTSTDSSMDGLKVMMQATKAGATSAAGAVGASSRHRHGSMEESPEAHLQRQLQQQQLTDDLARNSDCHELLRHLPPGSAAGVEPLPKLEKRGEAAPDTDTSKDQTALASLQEETQLQTRKKGETTCPLSPECFFLLRIVHHLLCEGVKAGLTLYDLAGCVARMNESGPPSPLERVIEHGTEMAHQLFEARLKNGTHRFTAGLSNNLFQQQQRLAKALSATDVQQTANAAMLNSADLAVRAESDPAGATASAALLGTGPLSGMLREPSAETVDLAIEGGGEAASADASAIASAGGSGLSAGRGAGVVTQVNAPTPTITAGSPRAVASAATVGSSMSSLGASFGDMGSVLSDPASGLNGAHKGYSSSAVADMTAAGGGDAGDGRVGGSQRRPAGCTILGSSPPGFWPGDFQQMHARVQRRSHEPMAGSWPEEDDADDGDTDDVGESEGGNSSASSTSGSEAQLDGDGVGGGGEGNADAEGYARGAMSSVAHRDALARAAASQLPPASEHRAGGGNKQLVVVPRSNSPRPLANPMPLISPTAANTASGATAANVAINDAPATKPQAENASAAAGSREVGWNDVSPGNAGVVSGTVAEFMMRSQQAWFGQPIESVASCDAEIDGTGPVSHSSSYGNSGNTDGEQTHQQPSSDWMTGEEQVGLSSDSEHESTVSGGTGDSGGEGGVEPASPDRVVAGTTGTATGATPPMSRGAGSVLSASRRGKSPMAATAAATVLGRPTGLGASSASAVDMLPSTPAKRPSALSGALTVGAVADERGTTASTTVSGADTGSNAAGEVGGPGGAGGGPPSDDLSAPTELVRVTSFGGFDSPLIYDWSSPRQLGKRFRRLRLQRRRERAKTAAFTEVRTQFVQSLVRQLVNQKVRQLNEDAETAALPNEAGSVSAGTDIGVGGFPTDGNRRRASSGAGALERVHNKTSGTGKAVNADRAGTQSAIRRPSLPTSLPSAQQQALAPENLLGFPQKQRQETSVQGATTAPTAGLSATGAQVAPLDTPVSIATALTLGGDNAAAAAAATAARAAMLAQLPLPPPLTAEVSSASAEVNTVPMVTEQLLYHRDAVKQPAPVAAAVAAIHDVLRLDKPGPSAGTAGAGAAPVRPRVGAAPSPTPPPRSVDKPAQHGSLL